MNTNEQESSDLIGQRQIRIGKLNKLKELNIDPFPSKSFRTNMCAEIKDNFEKFSGDIVTVAGRLMAWREHGQLVFGDVQDESGSLQLYIKEDNVSANDTKQNLNNSLSFEQFNLLDVGDLIEATGSVTKTQRGEISVEVQSIRILSKAIRPLPGKWDGIKDKETLNRKRYLDTILNPEKKDNFKNAAKIVFAIRQFLNQKGFLELQTPILQPIYGGGTAKPFKTHVNALDVDFYLAIAHELYLKRLIVAGFEKVYNICGYFRNEGIDRTHNPHFNMLETMSAFQNYEYNMELMEELYKYIGENVFNKTNFKIAGHEIDFGKKWERIQMIDAVKKFAGYDFNQIKTVEEAHKILDEIKFEDKKPASIGESMVKVFEEKVEAQLIEPTFIYGHPVEISPLAKRMANDPRFVERFEIYIGGIEGGDNWTELNDPLELYERFKDQVDRGRKGADEFHPMDVDFIEAIEYGMPPTSGVGPGIERLIMTFTETEAIDDIIFFPMMRPATITEQQKEIYGEEYLKNNEQKTKIQSPNIADVELSHGLPKNEAAQDFSKKIVIVVNKDLESWQVTNTVAHISAYLGNKAKEQLLQAENFTTKDGVNHPRNSQYAIITLGAKPGQMANFMQTVRESGLLYHGFIREMINTTNDEEIVEILKNKADSEIEYLGIGVFGDKDKIDQLTKKFSLWR